MQSPMYANISEQTFNQPRPRARKFKRYRYNNRAAFIMLPTQRTNEMHQHDYAGNEMRMLREQCHYHQQQIALLNSQVHAIRHILSKTFDAFDAAFRNLSSIQQHQETENEQPTTSDNQFEPMFF